MNQVQNFTKGFLKENPVFVLLLGMCPTLGTTTSAMNGLGMGLATAFCAYHVEPCGFAGKKSNPRQGAHPFVYCNYCNLCYHC